MVIKMKVFTVLTKWSECDSINEFHGDYISKETAQKYIREQENPEQFWIEEDEMNFGHIMCIDNDGHICPFPDDELEDDECINEEEFRAKITREIHEQLGIC